MKLPDKSMPPIKISAKRRKVLEKQKAEVAKKFAGGRLITDEEIAKRRELLKAQAREIWEKRLSPAEIKTYRE